jgi:hypothetical protein
VPALVRLFHLPTANPEQKNHACKTLFLLAHSEAVEKKMQMDYCKASVPPEVEATAAGDGGMTAAMQMVRRITASVCWSGR